MVQLQEPKPLILSKFLRQKVTNSNNKQPISAGLDDDFLLQRRENHLTTHFNTRKNRLLEITKENKHIHRRINAQKSLYSSR